MGADHQTCGCRVPVADILDHLGLATRSLPDWVRAEVRPDWSGAPSVSVSDARMIVNRWRGEADALSAANQAQIAAQDGWFRRRAAAVRDAVTGAAERDRVPSYLPTTPAVIGVKTPGSWQQDKIDKAEADFEAANPVEVP